MLKKPSGAGTALSLRAGVDGAAAGFDEGGRRAVTGGSVKTEPTWRVSGPVRGMPRPRAVRTAWTASCRVGWAPGGMLRTSARGW